MESREPMVVDLRGVVVGGREDDEGLIHVSRSLWSATALSVHLGKPNHNNRISDFFRFSIPR